MRNFLFSRDCFNTIMFWYNVLRPYILYLGRVLDGMLTVRKIENVPTGPNNKPQIPIVIVQCGQL